MNSPEKYHAIAQLARTPRTVPENATKPFFENPATRKIMAAESMHTAARHTATASAPARHAGTTIFHTARQAKTNDRRALNPTNPPNATSRAAKKAKRKTVLPMR